MTPIEHLKTSINAGFSRWNGMDAVPVFMGRQDPISSDASGVETPAVIIRLIHTLRARFYPSEAGITRPDLRSTSVALDGVGPITGQYFELECRARECEFAQQMGNDIVMELEVSGRLSNVLEHYDELDDSSQQRGEYFSNIVTVGIHAE